MSSQSNTAPVVERRYLAERDACMRAVELLLTRRGTKKAGGRDAAGDEKERSRNDSLAKTRIP